MDQVDSAIVELLEADGRMSYSDIARRLHVSRAAAAMHTERLIRSGAVDVRAVVNPEVMGLTCLGYLILRVGVAPSAVADSVASLPDAAFVSTVTGPAGVIAELRSVSAEAFADTVDRVRLVQGVQSIETLMYSRILRDAIAPVGPIAGTVDRKDLELLRELQEDGRMPFVELAQRTAISAAAARRRVMSLVDRRAVRFGSVRSRADAGARALLEVGVRLTRPRGEVEQAIMRDPAIIFYGEVSGAFDLLLTMRASAVVDLAAGLDRIRTIPGVGDVESWLHLDIAKESYARVQVPGRG
ncbi:MAG TPA: Lrp/AsnC family transcriptional regulator [Pseudolysinimonas sp.]|nr:Lrp/AsnC family transcriptional regulator [Pseudolysinimonas sp.]